MLGLIVALPLLVAPDSIRVPSDTTAARDSAATPKVVRRFQAIEVRASFHDPRSTETVRLLPIHERALPVDRLADVIATQPGVVVQGEDLHVRGGRAGETKMVVEGIELNEPFRDRPFDVPLVALRAANLMSGGLDAEYGGALAGVLDLRTVSPSSHLDAELQWRTTGAIGTRYDHVAARLGGPLGLAGIGAVVAGEATLDDRHLPMLRTLARDDALGGSFGWRADNAMTGYLKLARVDASSGPSLQILARRGVTRPYDPMWSFDGWVSYFCPEGRACDFIHVRPDSADGYSRYRAADHLDITDDRRLATILAWSQPPGPWRASGAIGWSGTRAITSLDGRDDLAYVDRDRVPVFGLPDDAETNPFTVYAGDEPYFKKTASQTLAAHADLERRTTRSNGWKVGIASAYRDVELFELDDPYASTVRVDTLRRVRAFAPSLDAYGQGRWEFEGLTFNTGLRLQYFTAGKRAGHDATSGHWSLVPRLGFSYPISARDAFSVSYVRVVQNPAVEYLYDNRIDGLAWHPLGNPALEPVEMISYQTGLKHLFERHWSMELSLFYRDLFGMVGVRNTATTSFGYRAQYTNDDQGHASGFELSLVRRSGDHDRIELVYTFLNAWGTQSREDGLAFGLPLGPRPEPTGEHPLDWDRRHGLALTAVVAAKPWLDVSWSTVGGSGLPWTPREQGRLDFDQTRTNSMRLPWSETTAVALQLTPRFLDRYTAGATGHVTLGLEVRNLFDERGDALTTTDGYPNPAINTVYDDYSAFRTATGRSGGAYWNDPNGDGVAEWVPVYDARLAMRPREIRLLIASRW